MEYKENELTEKSAQVLFTFCSIFSYLTFLFFRQAIQIFSTGMQFVTAQLINTGLGSNNNLQQSRILNLNYEIINSWPTTSAQLATKTDPGDENGCRANNINRSLCSLPVTLGSCK